MFKKNDLFQLVFFIFMSLVLIYFFAIHAADAQTTKHINFIPREINLRESTNEVFTPQYDEIATLDLRFSHDITDTLRIPWTVSGSRKEIDQRLKIWITDRDGTDTLKIAPRAAGRYQMWMCAVRDDNFLSGPLTVTFSFEVPDGWTLVPGGSKTVSVTLWEDEVAIIRSHRVHAGNIDRCLWQRPEFATSDPDDVYGFDLSKPVGFTVQPSYDLYDISTTPPTKISSGLLNITSVGQDREPGVTNATPQLACVNISGLTRGNISFEFTSTHSLPQVEQHLIIRKNHFSQSGRVVEVHPPGSSAKAFDRQPVANDPPAETPDSEQQPVANDPPAETPDSEQQPVANDPPTEDLIQYIRWLYTLGYTPDDLREFGLLPPKIDPVAEIDTTYLSIAANQEKAAGGDIISFTVSTEGPVTDSVHVSVRFDRLATTFSLDPTLVVFAMAPGDSVVEVETQVVRVYGVPSSGRMRAVLVTDNDEKTVFQNKLAYTQIVNWLGKSTAVAYPNPFNPETTISYTSGGGHVSISIYNIMGQRVREVVSRDHAAGTYRVRWDARDDGGRRVASGIYFAHIASAGESTVATIRLMLLK